MPNFITPPPPDFMPRGKEREYRVYEIIGLVLGAVLFMAALAVMFFFVMVMGWIYLG